MTLEMSSDSVSSPETKLLDRKGGHAGRGILTYFAYTSLIMIDSRQMGLMTSAHWGKAEWRKCTCADTFGQG